MKIKNKVEVIDDFIPVEYQNLIYDVLMGGKDLEGADDNAIQAPPAVFNIPMNGTGDYMQWYAYNLTGEAPELNFDYSSLSVTRIAGLKTTSRP